MILKLTRLIDALVRLVGRAQPVTDNAIIGDYCRYGYQLTAGTCSLILDTPWKVYRFPLVEGDE